MQHLRHRHPVRRNDNGRQDLVQDFRDLRRQVEIDRRAQQLRAVQNQIDAAGDRHLLGDGFERAIDLRDDVLAGFLDDAIAFAEFTARFVHPILVFALLGADLFRRHLCSVANEGLTDIAQGDLLPLRIFVQLLPPCAQFLVGGLIGDGQAQDVGNRQDADDRGGRRCALGDIGDVRHGRHRHLQLRWRRLLVFGPAKSGGRA